MSFELDDLHDEFALRNRKKVEFALRNRKKVEKMELLDEAIGLPPEEHYPSDENDSLALGQLQYQAN